MNIIKVIEKNKVLQEEKSFLVEKYHKELKIIEDQIEAPCKECKQEGMWRCETCSENFYEGYNIEDYPI